MTLFYFRPRGDDYEWADNTPSNFMAWFSMKFLKAWCDTPAHWTVRIMEYFWTNCPCCLFFRGVAVGILAAIAVSNAISLILW